MNNANGHDAPPAPTEAELREQERARLQCMADAIKAMLDRHEQTVEQRRRREAAS